MSVPPSFHYPTETQEMQLRFIWLIIDLFYDSYTIIVWIISLS